MDWPLALLITVMTTATVFAAWYGATEYGRCDTHLGDILRFGKHLLIGWFIGVLLWGAIALCFWVWTVAH